jgi:hypothetical protein
MTSHTCIDKNNFNFKFFGNYLVSTNTLGIHIQVVFYRHRREIGFSLIMVNAGNTKGGSITELLTSCLTGLELTV